MNLQFGRDNSRRIRSKYIGKDKKYKRKIQIDSQNSREDEKKTDIKNLRENEWKI